MRVQDAFEARRAAWMELMEWQRGVATAETAWDLAWERYLAACRDCRHAVLADGGKEGSDTDGEERA